MKHYPRLLAYKAESDPLSAFWSGFRFDIDYFTNWPQQDQKTLRNIVVPYVKLLLLERGSNELHADGRRFCMQPGDCLLIPPYTVHDMQTFEGVHCYELFFSVQPIVREQEFLLRVSGGRTSHFPQLLSAADFSLLRESYGALAAHAPGAYAQLSALLTLILLRMPRTGSPPAEAAPRSPSEQALVGRLFAHLEAHMSESVHAEQLCAALGVSQSYLYRCCRNVLNCSPSQAIARCKLRRAQALLKNPELSVGAVAEAIGYDPYYFSSQFKKCYLLSPSQYRRTLSVG